MCGRFILLTDGFYEWTGTKGHREAVRFRLRKPYPAEEMIMEDMVPRTFPK